MSDVGPERPILLVRAFLGVPPLLPEPPPVFAGVQLAGRCAVLPELTQECGVKRGHAMGTATIELGLMVVRSRARG